MNAADRTDLVRCWFEFDVADLAWPTRLGTVTLDGGTLAYRMLGRGAGVTGYDVDDCLSLVGRAIAPEPLPPVVRTVTDVDVDELELSGASIGVPVWRGVWFPPLNRVGPDLV